jgi:hypothetical protein
MQNVKTTQIDFIVLGCWNIWNEKSRKIFKNENNITQLERQFKEDIIPGICWTELSNEQNIWYEFQPILQSRC